jgi:hypothetical protein
MSSQSPSLSPTSLRRASAGSFVVNSTGTVSPPGAMIESVRGVPGMTKTTRERSALAETFWVSAALDADCGAVEHVSPNMSLERGPQDALLSDADLIEQNILRALEEAGVILFCNPKDVDAHGFPFNQRASLWDFSKLTSQLPRGTTLPVYSPWSEANKGVNRELKVGLAMALFLTEGDDEGTRQIESLLALVPDRPSEENEGVEIANSWAKAIVNAERTLAAKAEFAANPKTFKPSKVVTPSGVVHDVSRTAWMGDEKGFSVAFYHYRTGSGSGSMESTIVLCPANVAA